MRDVTPLNTSIKAYTIAREAWHLLSRAGTDGGYSSRRRWKVLFTYHLQAGILQVSDTEEDDDVAGLRYVIQHSYLGFDYGYSFLSESPKFVQHGSLTLLGTETAGKNSIRAQWSIYRIQMDKIRFVFESALKRGRWFRKNTFLKFWLKLTTFQ